MSNVTLQIGDFVFADTEVPESIPMPTKQKTVVHRMVGGARQIDTLGVDYDPLVWSGIIFGSQAMDRADELQGMVEDGLPLMLQWSEYQYQVILTKFVPDFEREWQIPYSIECEVLQDLSNPLNGDAGSSMDDLIDGDMSSANSLTSSIGDAGLTSSISSLQSSVSAVSSFSSATQAQLGSVLTPLAQSRTLVASMIASTDVSISSVGGMGGVVAGVSATLAASNLTAQISAVSRQSNLLQLSGVLGRMSVNIGQIGGGSKTIMQAGGSLFDLASKYYGDVSGWTAISAANPQLGGETMLTGTNTIIIPPYTGGSGGILNA